jgi:hypothetical protein
MADNSTLHLGITMAGAVSAGAYTAGVIDFLFEALQQWEEAKKKEAHLPDDQKTVPPHQIKIEVLGGASAGGITAALTALACYSGMDPVKDAEQAKAPDFKPENNLLFDAWVNLAGGSKIPEAIRRMLQNDDIRKAHGIPSLLNSGTIDELAENAIAHVANRPAQNWPAFISKRVELLLTLCSLRGIPVGIDFNSENSTWSTGPSHQMSIHKQYVRLMPRQKNHQPERAIPFDLADRKSLEQLMGFAKATSAFPIGLQAREVSLSREHIKHQFGTFYPFSPKTLDAIFAPDKFPDSFDFTSIDGGALNNEPFGEIGEIMKKRGREHYAVILIDPFPNFNTREEQYRPQQFLHELLFPTLSALRNQGMLKESDLREFGRRKEVPATYEKNMIFPSRRIFNSEAKKWEEQANPIACGALDGFSGLFCRDFRVHDFFLGRQNCRNFLRSYFTIAYKTGPGEENHKIFKDWTPQMRETYKVQWREQENKDVIYLPIIPLPDWVHEEAQITTALTAAGKTPEDIEAALQANARKTALPFPALEREQVNALRMPLAIRMFRIAWGHAGKIDSLFKRRGVQALTLMALPVIYFVIAKGILRDIRKNLFASGLLKPRRRRFK